jgi:TPR repeat protein
MSELHACEAAANAGVADAEFGYGLILWSSASRQHDRPAALDWFRKGARQGHQLAQSLLGLFLVHKDVEADLRNPVEAYAWRITAGNQKSAAKLRATPDERETREADRLAAEYSAKYGRPRPSASPWLTGAEVFLRVWPELVVLSFLALVRRRLKRKLLFIFAGSVIAYTSSNQSIGR